MTPSISSGTMEQGWKLTILCYSRKYANMLLKACCVNFKLKAEINLSPPKTDSQLFYHK